VMRIDKNIVISGVGWAKKHKREFDGVITIQDPDKRHGLRFHQNPRPDHLILLFVDLDEPLPEPYCNNPKFKIATDEQIQSALNFGKNHKNILIHCQVGVARSTAVALGIIAEQFGKGFEKESLDYLLQIRSIAIPNLHVVDIIDRLLQRDGVLLNIVKEWDRTIPENGIRRVEQRKAYFSHYGLPRNLER
jgi:predicted protein tyrosine phosphatase